MNTEAAGWMPHAKGFLDKRDVCAELYWTNKRDGILDLGSAIDAT